MSTQRSNGKSDLVLFSGKETRAKNQADDDDGIRPFDKRETMKLKLYMDQIKRKDLPMDHPRGFSQ